MIEHWGQHQKLYYMSQNLMLNFTETGLLQDLKYGTPFQNISELPLVSNNLGINILNGQQPNY